MKISRRKIRRYLTYYNELASSGWANHVNSTPLADIRAVVERIRAMPWHIEETQVVLPEWMHDLFQDDDPYLAGVRFL